MIPKELSDEIRTLFRDSVESICVDDGRWLGVLWQIKDGKLVMTRVAMHDFPKDDFLEAVSQLTHRMFTEVVGTGKEEKPLPLADFLKSDDRFKGLLPGNNKDKEEEPCDG